VHVESHPHTAHAEKLFDILDGIADSTKKKVQLWPLMNVLLFLCPVRLSVCLSVCLCITIMFIESVDGNSTKCWQRGFTRQAKGMFLCVCVCIFILCFALQRSFLTAIEKAITAPGSFSSSNKMLVEIAVVCGVELTKACTYINDHSNTVFRYYVTLLQNSIQVSNKHAIKILLWQN